MKNKYNLKNVTPEAMSCSVFMACPAIYELTPKEMSCAGALVCPRILWN